MPNLNYSVVSVKKKYYVKELKTNQKIAKFSTWNAAKKFKDHLNGGAGFNGFTPEFIIKPIKK